MNSSALFALTVIPEILNTSVCSPPKAEDITGKLNELINAAGLSANFISVSVAGFGTIPVPLGRILSSRPSSPTSAISSDKVPVVPFAYLPAANSCLAHSALPLSVALALEALPFETKLSRYFC